MTFFQFLHFFNMIVYVYLGVYIVIKSPKALTNRIAAAFLFCLALWSFSLIFIHNPTVPAAAAKTFINLSAFGWVLFGSFYLWFILAFTGKTAILKKKWFHFLLFGVPALFIYQQWAGYLFVDVRKEVYGWKPLFGTSLWPYLFALYCFIFMGIALYINFDFMRKTTHAIKKKQATIIFVTVSLVLAIGSTIDIILPLLNIHAIPNIAETIALIWAFGVSYAMARYKFLTITPATAADNIIATMHECLVLLDLEGNIVTVNKAGLDLLYYKEEELKGAPVHTLFTAGEGAAACGAGFIAAGNFKDREATFKTRQGEAIPVLLSCSELKDGSGAPGGMVCVAKDISQRKKMEEEILQAKKLESLGILAGGIAHDFNNLLSVIMGNISMAQDEVPHGEKTYDFLADAEKAAIRAAQLIGKFLAFSQSNWLVREKISLENILKNITESTLKNQGKDMSIAVEAAESLAPVNGDERQLRQVLEYLLLNAGEAIPLGIQGKITIRAENIADEDRADALDQRKTFLDGGLYVGITITDNGAGIPPENLGKIFDPYFSTKDHVTQKGLGLGLTICYAIIKKHGGHIRVESEPGKGTVVSLYLPAYFPGQATAEG